MSNQLYDKGRNKFAKGEIAWKSGGDTIRAVLVDSGSYTRDLAAHEFFSDLAGVKGNSGGALYSSGAQLTLADPVAGVCDANDVTLTGVTTGGTYEYIVIYKDGGSAGASPLIACIDTATGLAVTPNGGDITIAWDNGANKIFKL